MIFVSIVILANIRAGFWRVCVHAYLSAVSTLAGSEQTESSEVRWINPSANNTPLITVQRFLTKKKTTFLRRDLYRKFPIPLIFRKWLLHFKIKWERELLAIITLPKRDPFLEVGSWEDSLVNEALLICSVYVFSTWNQTWNQLFDQFSSGCTFNFATRFAGTWV